MKRKGSSLIAVLMLMTLLLILGMALLTQKSSQYEAAVRGQEAARARSIAQAGLVDCRLKLAKDRDFPPGGLDRSEPFTYSDTLLDATSNPVGTFTVSLNGSQNKPPFYVVEVTSVGILGDADSPRARFMVHAELDMSPTLRSDSNLPNPAYRRWTHYLDQQSPVMPP